jgi:hypothetical protein
MNRRQAAVLAGGLSFSSVHGAEPSPPYRLHEPRE